jgi:hypothetical protein
MTLRTLALGTALTFGLTAAAPAFAAKPIAPPSTPPPSCSVVTFSIAATSCLGFFDKNLVAEDGNKLAATLGIVDDLDPHATSLIEKIEWKNGQDPYTIDFDRLLSGKTVIGIHFGGGNTGYNGTGFWLLDLPNNTDKISYTSTVQKGISNAGLYLTSTPNNPGDDPGDVPAVPEPSTWAMMLLGFGLAGGVLRSRSARRTLAPA